MAQGYSSSRDRNERVITAARVALAASGLFAVWMDPAEPGRYTALTYGLHAVYVLYSVVLLVLVWSRLAGAWAPIVTHIVDIILFAIFQYLTLGPSSPFFVYFIFSLFCGAMRWGWRGTLRTAAIVVVAYLGMAVYMSAAIGPLEFEVNRFIIRVVYLAVSAALLVYLGRYEDRLRVEIERLARWPSSGGGNLEATLASHLEHAAEILDAGRAAVVWERREEPTVYLAVWPGVTPVVTRHSPSDLTPTVAGHAVNATFVSAAEGVPASDWIMSDTAGTRTESRSPGVHPLIEHHMAGRGLASAPFATAQVSGRVFFTDLGAPTVEIIALTEVVAREIGASLDHLHLTRQLQEIAASEERIRLARDLHDGVLQSLTGIRLEIRSVAGMGGVVDVIRDRLFAMERAIAIEQRELRRFIADLEPHTSAQNATPLAIRLQNLRERIAVQWKTPVTLNVAQSRTMIPENVEQAVPLMMHEAVVNALKHGQPSRVAVTVEVKEAEVRIVVTDDGRGFPFTGRFDRASLVEQQIGPRSLLNRVEELGGDILIDSSNTGVRVEIVLAL